MTLLARLLTPLTAVPAVTPPTRVQAIQPAVGFGSTASPKSTPTFDVVEGDLLILQAFSENVTDTIGTPTWDGSGTWTLQQSIVITDYCTAYLYTCDVTATATGRTITVARTAGSQMWSFYASQWRDHGGLGATAKASSASGAPALTMPLAAGSAVVCGNSDWAAADGTTRTWRTVNGAPMTEVVYFRSGFNYTMYTGYSVDEIGLLGTPQTLGLTTPAGQKFSIMAAEIRGTVVSEPTTPTGGATAAATVESLAAGVRAPIGSATAAVTVETLAAGVRTPAGGATATVTVESFATGLQPVPVGGAVETVLVTSSASGVMLPAGGAVAMVFVGSHATGMKTRWHQRRPERWLNPSYRMHDGRRPEEIDFYGR